MSKVERRIEYSDVHKISESILLPRDRRDIDRALQISLIDRMYASRGNRRIYLEFRPMIVDHQKRELVVDHGYDGKGIDRPQNSMVELWKWEKTKESDYYGVGAMLRFVGVGDEQMEEIEGVLYRLKKRAHKEKWSNPDTLHTLRQKLGIIPIGAEHAIFIHLQEFAEITGEHQYRYHIAVCNWVKGAWKRIDYQGKKMEALTLSVDELYKSTMVSEYFTRVPGLETKTAQLINLAQTMYEESAGRDFADLLSTAEVTRQFESIRPNQLT